MGYNISAGGAKQNTVAKMFSSHPDTEARIKAMEARAIKEGIEKPETKTEEVQIP